MSLRRKSKHKADRLARWLEQYMAYWDGHADYLDDMPSRLYAVDPYSTNLEGPLVAPETSAVEARPWYRNDLSEESAYMLRKPYETDEWALGIWEKVRARLEQSGAIKARHKELRDFDRFAQIEWDLAEKRSLDAVSRWNRSILAKGQ